METLMAIAREELSQKAKQTENGGSYIAHFVRL